MELEKGRGQSALNTPGEKARAVPAGDSPFVQRSRITLGDQQW